VLSSSISCQIDIQIPIPDRLRGTARSSETTDVKGLSKEPSLNSNLLRYYFLIILSY